METDNHHHLQLKKASSNLRKMPQGDVMVGNGARLRGFEVAARKRDQVGALARVRRQRLFWHLPRARLRLRQRPVPAPRPRACLHGCIMGSGVRVHYARLCFFSARILESSCRQPGVQAASCWRSCRCLARSKGALPARFLGLQPLCMEQSRVPGASLALLTAADSYITSLPLCPATHTSQTVFSLRTTHVKANACMT